jgi:hypothetical protein
MKLVLKEYYIPKQVSRRVTGFGLSRNCRGETPDLGV